MSWQRLGLKILLLILGNLGVCPLGVAGDVIHWSGVESRLELYPALEIALQPERSTWEGVATKVPDLSFQKMDQHTLLKLGMGTAWLRFAMVNDSSIEQTLILYGERVLYPVHIYRAQGGDLVLMGGVSPETIEDRADKELGTLTLPLRLGPGEKLQVYLKFQRRLPIANPRLSLLAPKTYRELVGFEQASRYLIVGISLTMLAYNFFMSLRLRQMQYFFYVAYLCCFLLNIVVSNLHVFTWFDTLWWYGIYAEWNSVTTDLVYLFATLFCLSFLKMQEKDPRFAKILWGFVLIFSLQALVGLLSPGLAMQLRAVSSLLGGALLFLAGVRAMMRRYPPASYFTLGWGIAIASNSGWILAGIGWISHSFWIDWGVSYGVVTEMFVLSLALSSRFQWEQKIAKAKIEELNQSLELKVYQQTREIRRLLEHTHLGLLSIEQGLTIHRDYSRHLESILECRNLADCSIWDVLFAKAELSEEEKARVRCALEYSIGDHLMFFEANQEVLPVRIMIFINEKKKVLDLDWSAITREDEHVERILLGITDVTNQLSAEAEAAASRLRLQCIAEFLEFGAQKFQKLASQVKLLMQELEVALEKDSLEVHGLFLRVHTLKSRARMEKYLALTAGLHELEDHLQLRPEERKKDRQLMKTSLVSLAEILGEYHAVLASMARFKQEDAALVEGSLRTMLESYGPMVRALAKDLGRVDCQLQIELAEDRSLGPLLQEKLSTALLHIFRNAVDHGAETLEERSTLQKPVPLTILVRSGDSGQLWIEDDGRGLNLKKIAEKAVTAGLSFSSLVEQANLVFHSGFSTKDQADHHSGRGVGMEVVREALRDVGGDAWIEVLGEPLAGGYVRFRLVLVIPGN